MPNPAFTSNDRRPPASTNVIDCSFTKVGSGLIADEAVQIGNTGTGMTVAQSFGNLLVDTGTTANAEFIWRSTETIAGAHIARIKSIMSQRIVNQHVHIALADLIGENCAFTTSSDGLSITVTFPPGHGFTSDNIGQSVYLGGATGITSYTPGRYAITAVSGNSVTLSPVFSCTWTRSSTTATVTFLGGNPIFSIAESATVSASSDTLAIVNGVVSLLTQTSGGITTFTCLNAGATSGTLTLTMTAKAWTGSSSGRVTVYGWNCVHWVKNGTSATAAWFDSQRKGWASGDATVTVTTDASPGQILQIYGDGQSEAFGDASPATNATTIQFTGRGNRTESIPDTETTMYLFVSVFNGVSAPASTTRLTVGHFRMMDIGIERTQISGFDQTGTNSVLLATVSASNLSCNTAQWGGQTVVTGGLNGTVAIGGAAAHSAASTTNPATVGGRVVPTTTATVDLTLAAGDASFLPISTGYQVIAKQFATSDLDWSGPVSFTPTQWASASTLTQLRAASGTASVRTYVTGMQLSTDTLGAATSFWLLDGAVSVSSATVATPGVFTSGTHDFKVGDAIVFQGLSGLAITGVSANQVVYVVTVPSTTTFTVALTRGGTGVQVTVTGTATVYRILRQFRLQTTALPVTDFHFPSPIRTAPNVALSCIASGTTTGLIYPDVSGYYGF